jgi:hypothetical protein
LRILKTLTRFGIQRILSHGSRFHLVACVEIASAAELIAPQKMPGWCEDKF